MVELDILSDIVMQLVKSCGIFNDSTDIFGDLPIVIVIDNIYQFPSIKKYVLWIESKTNNDRNSKILWLSFLSLIILIQQIRQ